MHNFLFTVFFAGISLGFVKAYVPAIAKLVESSPFFVGLSVTALTLSWPVFGIISGWLLDKYNRITVLTSAYLAYAVICLACYLALTAHLEPVVIIIIFALFGGCCIVVHENVYMTIPKNIAHERELEKINSQILVLDFLAGSFIGASLSGIFSDGARLKYAFLLLFVMLLLAAYSCTKIKIVQTKHHFDKLSLLDGFKYLCKDKLLLNISILAFLLSFAFGIYQTFLVFFVTNSNFLNLPIKLFGYVYAIYGIGIVLGGLIATKLVKKIGMTWCIMLDVLATAGVLLIPALSRNPYIVMPFMLIAGACVALWFVSTSSIRQKITPNHLLGKVNGAYRIFAYFGMPVGAFIGGICAIGDIKMVAIIAGGLLIVLSIPFIIIVNRAMSDYKLNAAK